MPITGERIQWFSVAMTQQGRVGIPPFRGTNVLLRFLVSMRYSTGCPVAAALSAAAQLLRTADSLSSMQTKQQAAPRT